MVPNRKLTGRGLGWGQKAWALFLFCPRLTSDLICSFNPPANNYLLNTYYVPGTGDTIGHKLDILAYRQTVRLRRSQAKSQLAAAQNAIGSGGGA